MNRERAKELLPIIQAFAEGKEIQILDRSGSWQDLCGYANFNADDHEYRIKPEPREFWVRVSKKNDGVRDWSIAPPPDFEGWIKVREVIE